MVNACIDSFIRACFVWKLTLVVARLTKRRVTAGVSFVTAAVFMLPALAAKRNRLLENDTVWDCIALSIIVSSLSIFI